MGLHPKFHLPWEQRTVMWSRLFMRYDRMDIFLNLCHLYGSRNHNSVERELVQIFNKATCAVLDVLTTSVTSKMEFSYNSHILP